MFPIPFLSRCLGAAFGLFMLCLLPLVLATGAGAAGPGPGHGVGPATGGYTGPGPALVSVQQALSMPHDTAVTLKGNITRYLGKDEYTFTDSSGAAEVRIGPHAWMGQYVGASDTVELHGEIKMDRKHTGRHIRVHRVVKQ